MITVLKFLLRLSGYAFLSIAIIAGIADASTSIAQSQLYLAPLGQVWANVSPETLDLSRAFIQSNRSLAFWEPGIETVLAWPVWAVFAPLGLFCLWLGGRRRSQRIQYV